MTAPLSLPVHPHQLEVQEFDSYSLIVDTRDAAEYVIDHVPGAVSVPWSSDAPVPAQGVLQAAEGRSGVPYGLAARLTALEAGAPLLVYCDRGGIDSSALATLLRQQGFEVDVLPGGWGNYRRWVAAGLEILIRALELHWVRAAPGGVSLAFVEAFEARGQQVLKLASLLGQRALPGVSLTGEPVLSAQALETRLVDVLRGLDPAQPVWIDEVLPLGAQPSLPPSFQEALSRAAAVRVELPDADRKALLLSRLRAEGHSLGSLVQALEGFIPVVSALGQRAPSASSEVDEDVLAGWLLAYCERCNALFGAPREPGREQVMSLVSMSEPELDRALATLVR